MKTCVDECEHGQTRNKICWLCEDEKRCITCWDHIREPGHIISGNDANVCMICGNAYRIRHYGDGGYDIEQVSRCKTCNKVVLVYREDDRFHKVNIHCSECLDKIQEAKDAYAQEIKGGN